MERVLFAPREPPPLRPDVAADLPRYREWVRSREERRLAGHRPDRPVPGPEICVAVVVDRPEPALLERCLASVLGQTVSAWHLWLAVVGGTTPLAERALARVATVAPGRVSRGDHPGGTTEPAALAGAVAASTSPAVLWLGQHDQLAPDALALLAAALGGSTSGDGDGDGDGGACAELAYADEDRTDRDGRQGSPALKPDWSPELLLSLPYAGRPLAVRRDVLERAGGIRELAGGDWEHDVLLRLAEVATRVVHVAEVLGHRHAAGDTPGAGGRGTGGGDAAVVRALARRGESGEVSRGPVPGSWYVRRHHGGPALATAVIPFRDGAPYLRAAMDTISATRGRVELDVVLVDNGSVEPETQTLLDRLADRPGVTVRRDDRPFNWAALNNAAVAEARGDVLVFLNNDIEARRNGWLDVLVAQALRPEVGAVGARLLYPTGRVQHAGVVIGMGGAAGHVLAGLSGDQPGYLGMAVLTRDCSAVTGACLATRRHVFEDVGGFDESLGLDLNDIDYCLQVGRRGLRVVYEPLAELLHHESPSRGTSGSVADIARFITRWEDAIVAGDPHLNRHLTRVDLSCALRGSGEEGWWREWRSNLGTS